MGAEKNLYTLAAAYSFHLIQNHSFVDGNQRIGTLTMMTFLRMNQFDIDIPNKELYNLAMKIATSKTNEEMIALELKKYSLSNICN